MLAPMDDFLIHQTPRTVEYPGTTDLRFFERLYFNVHDRSGKLALITGLGVYPNMNCMDGFACAVLNGETDQYNARFFRELESDRCHTQVGPLSFNVVEPMRKWELRLGPNPYYIEFELEMTARFEPWNTPVSYEHAAAAVFDMSHFVQSCSYRGTVKVRGQTFDLDDFLGVRDRSWGVRPLAQMPMPGNSHGQRAMHLWLNPQFEDSSFFVFYMEDADSRQLMLQGGIVGGPKHGRHWAGLEHELKFREGIRTVREGQIRLTDDTGEVHELSVSAELPPIYLQGAGYWVTQGKFMGDHHEGERWDVTSAAPATLARYGGDNGAQQPALFTTGEGQKGYGLAEYSFRPTYKKYPANQF